MSSPKKITMKIKGIKKRSREIIKLYYFMQQPRSGTFQRNTKWLKRQYRLVLLPNDIIVNNSSGLGHKDDWFATKIATQVL